MSVTNSNSTSKVLESGTYQVAMDVFGEYLVMDIDGKVSIEIKKNNQGYIVDGWRIPSNDDEDLLFTETIWNENLECGR